MQATVWVYGMILVILTGGLHFLLGKGDGSTIMIRGFPYWTRADKKMISPGWKRMLEQTIPGVRGVLEKGRREKMNMEIYEAISFLRNITVLGRGSSCSADTMLELLVERKGILAPIYGRMLQMLRQNQPGEAVAYFSEKVNTDIGKDFARLIVQWDSVDPRHLMETLLSHQKNIREVRMTALKRRDEIVSDLIYLPVVVNIMLIFINFIYVGYYMDQSELLMSFT